MGMNLIKRENASELVLTVMKWAILSLFSMRTALILLNYPTVGRGNWHVAHAFTGGIIMWIGAMIGYMYYGGRIKKISAAIFGVGLGLFVDEIGKYLSRDNNYFFQPAFSLIYVFFIILFLIYRYLEKNVPKEARTILFQVMDKLEELSENDLEKSEKLKLLRQLKEVTEKGDEKTKNLALELGHMVERIEPIEDKTDGWSKRLWKIIRRYSYHKVFKRKWVLRILLLLAIGYIIGGIVDSIFIISRFKENWLFELWYGNWELLSKTDFRIFTLMTVGDGLSCLLFIGGIYWLSRGKKSRGFGFFQYGLLVNIFISSAFKFYFEQFSGIFGVLTSIIVLEGLKKLKQELVK